MISEPQQKLRITFILGVFPALSETFILNQITGLLDLGHDVDIFSLQRMNSKTVHEEISKYNLLKRAYFPEWPVIKSRDDLRMLLLMCFNFLKNPGTVSRTHKVFKSRKDNVSLKLLPLCFQHFKRNAYDIIHCQFGPNGNLGALMKELGVSTGKLVTTFHGYDIRLGLERGAHIYEPLRTGGDLFLAISKYNRTCLEKMGFDPHKIADHSVGIDPEKFIRNHREMIRPGEEIRIVTVARLVKEKGLEFGIRSIGELIERNPGLRVRYDIIGDGKLRGDLEALSAGAGLTGVIRFLGEMNHTGVSERLNQAHIFLLPSLNEALPVALMEAQAAGLPVVATDVGGISEVVAHGKSGYLVPRGDVAAIRAAIESLIRNPGTWTELGSFGRKIVEEKYHIKKLNVRLVELYRSLLSGRA